jgi:ABC-2 type transport system permease protein
VVVCFALRYLVNITSFWLLDIRGVMSAWALTSGLFCGLTMPITFFPQWVQAALWLTPFPAIMQVPLDTALERHGAGVDAGLIGIQALWAVLLLAVCLLVQRRAVRRLVVQGG